MDDSHSEIAEFDADNGALGSRRSNGLSDSASFIGLSTEGLMLLARQIVGFSSCRTWGSFAFGG